MSEKDYQRMVEDGRAIKEWHIKTGAITVALLCWSVTLLSLLRALRGTF